MLNGVAEGQLPVFPLGVLVYIQRHAHRTVGNTVKPHGKPCFVGRRNVVHVVLLRNGGNAHPAGIRTVRIWLKQQSRKGGGHSVDEALDPAEPQLFRTEFFLIFQGLCKIPVSVQLRIQVDPAGQAAFPFHFPDSRIIAVSGVVIVVGGYVADGGYAPLVDVPHKITMKFLHRFYIQLHHFFHCRSHCIQLKK